MTVVTILGGAGLVSRGVAYDLALDSAVDEIRVADIDLAGARSVSNGANRIAGEKKACAVKADVTKRRETLKLVKGTDFIVNGVQYDYNIEVMEIALRAGCSYLDFGGLYWMTRKQLRMDAAFRKAGLLAIAGMGAEPGLSGILASHLCAQLDSVDTIKIRDAWRDRTENLPPFIVTWSIQTLMDEYTMPAEIMQDGRIRKVKPLSMSETFEFPPPVGVTEVYVTRHSEIATFPESFRSKGLKNVNWMEGGPGFLEQKILADAGLGDKEPLSVDGCNVQPRRFLTALLRKKGLLGYPSGVTPQSFECLAVEVIGSAGGEKHSLKGTCLFPSKPEWGLGAAEYSVSIPAAVALRHFISGRIRMRGVKPPELLFDSERFISDIREKGFSIAIERN